MDGIDWHAVGVAGGSVSCVAAIAIPLWRRFLAQQLTDTARAAGEATWLRRQAEDLTANRAMVMELIALRAADAEVIAGLRLEKALAKERADRMAARLQRMEDFLVEHHPQFARWIRDDTIDIPPLFDPVVFEPPEEL